MILDVKKIEKIYSKNRFFFKKILWKLKKSLYNKSLRYLRILNDSYSPRPYLQFMEHHFNGVEISGVEIGVWKGDNAKMILDTLNIKKLYLIDPYIGETRKNDKAIALKKLRLYDDKCNFIFKKSSEAIFEIPFNVDFVYIDGNHDYDFVKNDINLYFKKIRKGGIIAGHDFDIYDVARAVIEFAAERGIHSSIQLAGYRVDWWFIKKT